MIGQNNLVVVAHPDDETLWCGGTILMHTGVRWHVLCLSTPRRDPLRAQCFLEACRRLGAVGRCSTTVESDPDKPLNIVDPLPTSANGQPFDCVITHNAMGEYGHLHHRQVHARVLERYRDVRLLTFGFNDPDATLGGVLMPPIVKAKIEVLKAYHEARSYEGAVIPKWEALLQRYGSAMLGAERFREVRP